METTDKVLKHFDEYYDMFNVGKRKTEDFSPLIEQLEFLLNQMKITREVSIEVKNHLGDCSEEEFTIEATKRLEPKLKNLKTPEDETVKLLFFELPDKKGKIFFQLMKRMEDAGKLPFKDKSKREKIDLVITDLENYIENIKKISKSFVPADFDPNQTIILKIYLKRLKNKYRIIEIQLSKTLKDLHNAIQHAIDWYNDHLYSFFMDNDFSNHNLEFTCPYETEGTKTADVKIGCFDLKKYQKFGYLFDFGDMHEFEIQVINFGKVEKGKKYPALIESKGKFPEQYPDYE